MKKLYKARRVNDFDRAMREKYSLNSLDLIENAAKGALEMMRDRLQGRKTLILVGSGNNGADGINLFLLMQKEWMDAHVYYVSEGKSEENMSLRALVPPGSVSSTLCGYDVIVDAIYGASFHPPLGDDVRSLLDEVNSLSAFRAALDVPSAYYFKADLTITFTMLKEEEVLSAHNAGRIVLFNPGFPDDEIESYAEDSYLLEDEDYSAPSFSDVDYKNTRGHLLMKAGSPSYKGAAILSAKAAFHAGCGLVTLNADRGVRDMVYSYPPLIIREGNVDYTSYSALLAGPGWGECGNRSFLGFKGNMVLDADALAMIEKGDDFEYRAVLTPHVGEFRRLSRRLGIEEDAVALSKALRAVVVKKSNIVEIVYSSARYFYVGDNPSLGVAGSGDVLAGIIGAFLASGLSPLEAAINGVILHQMSGRKAHERLGYYDSLDLIEEVGRLR